ncbi:enoyl-CoA hydratase/isomerase family protein [Sphingosinicella microcystinivorans]|uniref:2-(1,2-epoxy-1,2-dihydrophenyl)acetyl-CoA isomerase n=1 Tax=Sphingosinicella microcystinivorans TaxID=335406 RepID=A0AAD1D339_SPHMI|nr:enoyl-CoA hydratase/isomerase family protein [Sphingosinicella microcystinivorans]RKS88709.1 2-(1,2-epoxy-1,2-dihydrophenyl)acetyl-CoA isomerase [Sphingosinicella microcystinivorans]BBE32463.1 2-(1,2-epoxy-1,2-dihydrophenyl)acetyl-CoA isomerase [Sphingosinicella microcystinivorans]
MNKGYAIAIEVEHDSPIAIVTLASPGRGNALGPADLGRIASVINDLATTDDVGVIILTGRDGIFSAGAALDVLADSPADELAAIVADQTRRLAAAIAGSPVAIVAAVDGAAAGSGAGIALLADIMVMSSSARLLFPFARLGLVPDTGINHSLIAAVGSARARALLMTGGSLSAEQCLDLGLAQTVVPEEELADAVRSLAIKLAGVPRGTHGTIRALLASSEAEAGLIAEAQAQADRMRDPITQAALTSALALLRGS